MPNATPPVTLEQLANLFRRFAERECKQTSNLYYQLSLAIAEDAALLELASNCRVRQPIPNLFLAAIHYVLLQAPTEPLAAYYPSISKTERPAIPFDLFKAFCHDHQDRIIEIISTRIVQTNALNRTAYLMPIIAANFKQEAVTLVDIGTSSGLTMNLDRYEYDYGSMAQLGNSKVKIKSKIVGGTLPVFSDLPQLKRKIGIDQNPLDLKVEDNALWLKALIWPDLRERFLRIEAAIELAQHSNIELLQAQTVEAFKAVIRGLPKNEALLVYHTHVLYQFKPSERARFRAMLDELGMKRNFSYLAVEGSSVFDNPAYLEKGVHIELTSYQDSNKHSQLIALTDGHATWIDWR